MVKQYVSETSAWYKSEEGARAYLELTESKYGQKIDAPEKELLSENSYILASVLNHPRQFIDFGPGNGQKTFQIVSCLHSKGLVTKYLGVDIQPLFLDITEDVLRPLQLPLEKYVGTFDSFLDSFKSDGANHVSVGFAYGNTDESFDQMFASRLHENDSIYLSSGLYPTNIDAMVETYLPSINMFRRLAIQLGLSSENPFVVFNELKNQVEIGFDNKDDRHVLAISKKPTVDQFVERVKANFKGNFFKNDSHIGFVGFKR